MMMAWKGLVFGVWIFLSQLTSAETRRTRQIHDVRAILARVSGLESSFYKESLKFEKQLSEIKDRLDQLSGGIVKPVANDVISQQVNEIIKDSLNGIQAGLISEKQQRLRLENMAMDIKETVSKNEICDGGCGKLRRLEGKTGLLENRIESLEEACSAGFNSTMITKSINSTVFNGSSTTKVKNQLAVVLGVQFSGKVLNANDSRIVNDCRDLVDMGYRKSGVFRVNIIKNKPILIVCDLSAHGWMVVQRRNVGTLDFEKNWNEYKEGFGNFDSEFWLGNDILWLAISSSYLPPNGHVTFQLYA